jgi:hypothetical protein
LARFGRQDGGEVFPLFPVSGSFTKLVDLFRAHHPEAAHGISLQSAPRLGLYRSRACPRRMAMESPLK